MENYVLLTITVMALLASPRESALVGHWACSYEILGESYSASVTENFNYLKGGRYESVGVSEYKYPEDIKVAIEIHFQGEWRIKKGYLQHRAISSVVKKTSVEWITVEAAQAELDRTEKGREWTKNSFQITNGVLTRAPIEPKRPELKITTTCVKA